MSSLSCFNGNKHVGKLEEIYRITVADDEEVVRWCSICGAIVVDVEYDGRLRPGEIMPMKFPLIQKCINMCG